jgi:Rrf2 family protein
MSATNVQFSVAAHIMTALGCAYRGEVTSSTLAESVNADATFVRKMVSKLAKAGLVVARRGKGGACVLSRPPEEISLLDIYHAAQAPLTFAIHTYPVEAQCSISCNIKTVMNGVLEDAQKEFEKSLANHTLWDLVTGVRKPA